MRHKWFAPASDGQPYSPFGIDCEGAATPSGRHSGRVLMQKTGSDEQTSPALVDPSWVVFDQMQIAPPPRGRLMPRLREERST